MRNPIAYPPPSEAEIASAVDLLRSSAPNLLARILARNTAGDPVVRERDGDAAGRKGSGLAPWQVKRARTTFEVHLREGVAVDEVALACGLSRSHFAYAFQVSTGSSPHRWLVKRRVEKAKECLRNPAARLCDVAIECGFADQSHLTRLFRRETGMTPGSWRRTIAPDDVCMAAPQAA